MDEGTDERVLGEIFRVGRSEQAPAEVIDGPVKSRHQFIEGPRIAVTGAMRKLKFCPAAIRIRVPGHALAGFDDRTLLSSPSAKSTGESRDYFRERPGTALRSRLVLERCAHSSGLLGLVKIDRRVWVSSTGRQETPRRPAGVVGAR